MIGKHNYSLPHNLVHTYTLNTNKQNHLTLTLWALFLTGVFLTLFIIRSDHLCKHLEQAVCYQVLPVECSAASTLFFTLNVTGRKITLEPF